MHRDPKQDKCNVLPFGDHREHQDWPEWVTVKNRIKVVGPFLATMSLLTN